MFVLSACSAREPDGVEVRLSEASTLRLQAQAWDGTVEAMRRTLAAANANPSDAALSTRALAAVETAVRGVAEGKSGDAAEILRAAGPLLDRLETQRDPCPSLSTVADVYAWAGQEDRAFQLHDRAAMACRSGASALRRTQLARSLRRCDAAIDWVAGHFALFEESEALVAIGEVLECGSPALIRQRMPFLSGERIESAVNARAAAEAMRAERCGAACGAAEAACRDFCQQGSVSACVQGCSDRALVCRAGCGL